MTNTLSKDYQDGFNDALVIVKVMLYDHKFDEGGFKSECCVTALTELKQAIESIKLPQWSR